MIKRETAEAILVAHQLKDSGGCLCGWDALGKSHAGHQVATLARAGVVFLPSDGATVLKEWEALKTARKVATGGLPDDIQVMVSDPALARLIVDWLSAQGKELVLYPHQAEDDLPTYFVGLKKGSGHA